MKTVEEFKNLILSVQPIDLREFVDVIPELQPLDSTIHGSEWHQEGSVLNHTNMAMHEILNEMQNFPKGFAQVALYLAILCHDFGKPSTAQPRSNNRGGFSFHGHEKAGVWVAKDFLKKYFSQFNYRQRDLILNLVQYSGHPKRMIEDGSSDAKFKQVSLTVPTPFLYHLEIADFKGRIGPDLVGALTVLDKFKQRCEDLNIYKNHGYQIPNSSHFTNLQYSTFRWNILMHGKDETDQKEMERIITLTNRENPPNLTLLVGCPGSGKSTYRNQVTDCKIVCMDDRRKEILGDPNNMSKNQEVFNWSYKEVRKGLKAGESVLVDATNWSRKARKTHVDAARTFGCFVNMVVWDLPLETLLKRNSEREKKVPDDVVRRFYKELEFPSSYEYDKLVVIES